ncbi:LysM peptidoglycan-binding domain-containing protein [Kurthia huakuii]|uniref:LysM peptidoglycan-binding domain-containing protein n=1 Tax=Kurthia huakuii TaxID=1421019 RepID=UPI0004955A2F|nr:LysM peptidoglycan-binding domain-containing protein [Kurthia huakuii]MBM7699315.1 flagellum-specific peptidoglycan hydrolase FlgJ/murein DD-endopeptidase MepM/ murein hydrolase activator NlpD [Kurthia huakuii]
MKYNIKVAAAVLTAFTALSTPLMTSTASAEEVVVGNTPLTQETATGNAFIDMISTDVVTIANEYNLYASVMLAQAALESNYGKSGLASAPNYNLFGIKGQYNGQSSSFATNEQTTDGTVFRTTASFRKYASYEESLKDYAVLLTGGTSGNSTYYQGVLKQHTMSYKQALQALEGRYATDTNYASKLQAIIDDYDLTRFDTMAGSTEIVANEDGTTTTNVEAKKVIAVVSGDTLGAIAKTYAITVEQLMEWNGLTSTLLAIGDELVVEVNDGTAVEEQQVVVAPATPKVVKKTYTATKKYSVKKGDSLTAIAKHNDITTAQLKEWNDLSSASLKKGQKLAVAVKEEPKNSAPKATQKTTVATKEKNVTEKATKSSPEVQQVSAEKKTKAKIHARYYTVQAGDSLASIARAFLTTETKLKQANKLSSNLVYEGQKIKIQ